MKRTLPKSGSTAAAGHLSSTLIPPYVPLSPLSKSNKQSYSGSSANIFTLLQQDSKQSKQQQPLQLQPQQTRPVVLNPSSTNFPPSSIASQNLSSNLQAALASAKSNPSWGLPLSKANQNVQPHSSLPTSSNMLQSQQQMQQLLPTSTNILQQHTQRLLMSTQKQSPPIKGTSNSLQKSPGSTTYRTQTTPTSIKNSLYSTVSQSPKLNLQAQIQQVKQNTPIIHQQRQSLAQQQIASSNENIPIRNQDSKVDQTKKPYYFSASTEHSSNPSQYQNSILKENNSHKNNTQITKIARPTANSLAAKDLQDATKNYRNNSSSASMEIHSIASNRVVSEHNGLTSIPTVGSERNYASMPRTNATLPSASATQNSRSSLQMALLNTMSHNTEYLESQPHQYDRSTDESALNLSALSSNMSQLNISDRVGVNPISHSETTQVNLSMTQQQQCVNHPHKKAKYIIFNSQTSTNLYCSKCAVELSKFGFQTIHIADYQRQQTIAAQEQQISHNASSNMIEQELGDLQAPSSERDVHMETQAKMFELRSFIEKIDSSGGKWQELNHALLIKKQDVCNFYDRQEQRIESQYSGYLELITSLKQKTLDQVLASKEKAVQAYQQWEKETKENLTDFINIKADIDMNTDKIVHQIQMDDFTRIMLSYKDKFERMTTFFQEMMNQTLDLVKFDTQSPLPVSFASQLAESFSITNFTTTLVKKRVSEFKQFTRSQHQSHSQNSNSSILYSSNNTPSPNVKSTRLSTTAPSGIDQQGISTRGSIGASQHQLGSSNYQNPSQFYSQPTETVSEYSHYYPAVGTVQTHHNNHSNSPVKTEPTARSDLSKKEVYVSFGNNKEASLLKAIEHVKQSQQVESNYNSQLESQQQQYMDSIQQTPSQHNGVYIHQVKPLTDILENSNIQDEEDHDGKSQPNTPELKQYENNNNNTYSNNRNSEQPQQPQQQQQQRPFRTLFGEEEPVADPIDQQHSSQQNKSSYSEFHTQDISAAKNEWVGQLPVMNQQKQYGGSISSVVSKSPRYSMYECDESDQPITYELPKVSSTNNQLDEYIQMLERQNGPAEYQSISNSNLPAKAGYSYGDDEADGSDSDHPLFSSPKQN